LPLLLAIESSCDETAAAVVRDGHEVLSSAVATQIEIHRKFGGVVPELASRNHVVDAVPVVREALETAGLTLPDVDAIAVTQGPGLVGALLIGLQVAKALAFVHGKPLIPVHHLAGHLHGVFLHRPGEPRPAGPAFPHVALCVSGGHTALYRVEAPDVASADRIRLLAQTRDDAAGEAFDKVARMLGLGYPGGPIIESRAQGGSPRAHRFTLPRFKDDAPLDFSFSGLKTAVLTVIQHLGRLPEGQALTDLLASFQQAAVDQLVDRTCTAARQQGVRDVQIAGGVASNRCLRETLAAALSAEGMSLHVPPPRYCTDNAAMIAGAADFAAVRLLAGPPGARPLDLALNARPTWPLAGATA
jgi:N6-L-threonylcarbamoyladenine synthase